MALARKDLFQRKDAELADFSKALAHPARLAILAALAEKRECICGDLVLGLPLAQSTVSQHLKALKEAGLIRGLVDGPRSRYCIDWKLFSRYLKLQAEWSEKLGRFRQENRYLEFPCPNFPK
jgi:DNA-binding transcriptional ArsR family regulator